MPKKCGTNYQACTSLGKMPSTKLPWMRNVVRLKYRDGDKHSGTHQHLQGVSKSTCGNQVFPIRCSIGSTVVVYPVKQLWELGGVSQCFMPRRESVFTSILNEETRRKDKGVLCQSEANVAQYPDKGRSKQRSPHKRDKTHIRSKSRGKLTCSRASLWLTFCSSLNSLLLGYLS